MGRKKIVTMEDSWEMRGDLLLECIPHIESSLDEWGALGDEEVCLDLEDLLVRIRKVVTQD